MSDSIVPAAEDGTPPSLRERKRAHTRQAILDAVALIELAYGGALNPEVQTFAKIAEVAGVSERTVYRMFPSKADLDEAYVSEQVLFAGVEVPADIDGWAQGIRDVMRHWSERLGHARIQPQDLALEEFPASLEDRRRRDVMVTAQVDDLLAPDTVLDERQRLALAATLHAAISVRSVAITAQRWGLTLDEAGMAHAWMFDTLLRALRDDPPEPWEPAE